MQLFNRTLREVDSPFGHYQVIETIYRGRPARVLFSGDRAAAQSGIAMDDNPELLFEYNQRLMEIVAARQPRRILLIGGGAYTLPRALGRIPQPPIKLDVVERDSMLLELAEKYFDFTTWSGLEIHHDDGRNFLNTTTEAYDMIIVDAFADLSVPRSLVTLEALQAYRSHLVPDGVLAMNVIAAMRSPAANVIDHLNAAGSVIWPHLEILAVERGFDAWQPQNLLFTAYHHGPAIGPLIHCATLPLLAADPAATLHDQLSTVDHDNISV